jgi:5-methylcytosine-specific restriction endonuclease McrA
MDDRLVQGILTRDRYCWVCGNALGTWHLHHRKLRKHGGSDSYQNVIAVHPQCHNLGTHSIHLNPEKAYENGWLVHSWENPTDIPVTRRGGESALLTTDGEEITLQGEEHTW